MCLLLLGILILCGLKSPRCLYINEILGLALFKRFLIGRYTLFRTLWSCAASMKPSVSPFILALLCHWRVVALSKLYNCLSFESFLLSVLSLSCLIHIFLTSRSSWQGCFAFCLISLAPFIAVIFDLLSSSAAKSWDLNFLLPLTTEWSFFFFSCCKTTYNIQFFPGLSLFFPFLVFRQTLFLYLLLDGAFYLRSITFLSFYPFVLCLLNSSLWYWRYRWLLVLLVCWLLPVDAFNSICRTAPTHL